MQLKAGKLYILSGVPGSGKSTFLKGVKGIRKEMVISTDAIREQLIGHLFSFGKKSDRRRTQDSNQEVFEIVNSSLKARLKERLTTFLDATNVSDKVRSSYVKLAKDYNVEAEILIFDDIEKAQIQNQEREFVVPEESMRRMIENFENTSIYPYRIVNSTQKTEFILNSIQKDIKLDIIGDIHGLYDEAILLLKKLGYDKEGNHPEKRKVVFLGDFVDRGLKSIDMIKLVRTFVKNGHYAIMGNHEEKLLRNAKRYENGEQPTGSYAVLKTFSDLLKDKEYDSLVTFIKSLPGYYIQGKFAFTHANITYFNPLETPYSELIYGTYKDYSKRDADLEYDELYKDGLNTYTLIRGHVEAKGNYRHVFSLEGEQCFKGNLMALSLDKFEGSNFQKGLTLQKSEFDFKSVRKTNQLFNRLVKEKLVTKKEYPLFSVYKYSKQVFYKNLWDKSSLLLKARGIVLDFAGNIVVHPFDKIFNYLENGAGKDIPDEEEVIYVEKFNGFLGNISLNPYTKKLLFSTTGTLDSDYSKMIEDSLEKEHIGKLYKFFSKNDMTLSFEVIHPEDPHIIKYDDNEMGLKLIGARRKTFESVSEREDTLDSIAQDLNFKRPFWGYIKFKDLKEKVRTSKLEGFMVRKNNMDQDFILKFKTPYYLVTKFLGRMGMKNIRFMFSNPTKFKETIDEEFYSIVDSIVNSFTEKKFYSLSEEKKMEIIRNFIENERKENV